MSDPQTPFAQLNSSADSENQLDEHFELEVQIGEEVSSNSEGLVGTPSETLGGTSEAEETADEVPDETYDGMSDSASGEIAGEAPGEVSSEVSDGVPGGTLGEAMDDASATALDAVPSEVTDAVSTKAEKTSGSGKTTSEKLSEILGRTSGETDRSSTVSEGKQAGEPGDSDSSVEGQNTSSEQDASVEPDTFSGQDTSLEQDIVPEPDTSLELERPQSDTAILAEVDTTSAESTEIVSAESAKTTSVGSNEASSAETVEEEKKGTAAKGGTKKKEAALSQVKSQVSELADLATDSANLSNQSDQNTTVERVAASISPGSTIPERTAAATKADSAKGVRADTDFEELSSSVSEAVVAAPALPENLSAEKSEPVADSTAAVEQEKPGIKPAGQSELKPIPSPVSKEDSDKDTDDVESIKATLSETGTKTQPEPAVTEPVTTPAQTAPTAEVPKPTQPKLPQTTEEEIEALLRLLHSKYAISREDQAPNKRTKAGSTEQPSTQSVARNGRMPTSPSTSGTGRTDGTGSTSVTGATSTTGAVGLSGTKQAADAVGDVAEAFVTSATSSTSAVASAAATAAKDTLETATGSITRTSRARTARTSGLDRARRAVDRTRSASTADTGVQLNSSDNFDSVNTADPTSATSLLSGEETRFSLDTGEQKEQRTQPGRQESREQTQKEPVTIPPRSTVSGGKKNPTGRIRRVTPPATPANTDGIQFGAELFGENLLGTGEAEPTARRGTKNLHSDAQPVSATQLLDTYQDELEQAASLHPDQLTIRPGATRPGTSSPDSSLRGKSAKPSLPTQTVRVPSSPASPPMSAETTQSSMLNLDERIILAGATVLPEIRSHVKKHWLSSVLTLLLTPLCWWLLADAIVRIQDASIANLAGESAYSAFGLVELLGGIAIIAILLFLSVISGVGLIVTGSLITVVGLAFLVAPGSMAGLLTPLVEAISDTSVGQVVVQNLSNTSFNGLAFITGISMLGGGIAISCSRRLGRAEEADRVEVAAINPDGLHARWAKKATEAARQRQLRHQHFSNNADDFFQRPQEGKNDKRRQTGKSAGQQKSKARGAQRPESQRQSGRTRKQVNGRSKQQRQGQQQSSKSNPSKLSKQKQK